MAGGLIDPNDDPATAQGIAFDSSQQLSYLLFFWLLGVVYGLYLVLFVLAVRITLKKQGKQPMSAKVFLGGAFTTLILTTAYTGISVYRLLHAFSVGYAEKTNMLPVVYLRSYTTWDSFASLVIADMLIWLADALVIYRCFIIWDNNYWVIALPILLLIGNITNSSIILIVFFHHQSSMTTKRFLPRDMVYPLNISQNCMTTGLIVWKIWQQHSRSRAAGVRASGAIDLFTVIRIVVESAMIFTLQQIISLVLYLVNSPGELALQGTLTPSIGIVFLLMVIRTDAASEHESTHLFVDPVLSIGSPDPQASTPANSASLRVA